MCPDFDLPKRILYEVQAPFFIIRFNSPGTLNSLCHNDYIHIKALLEKASKHPECIFTVLQSSGKFFSSGDSSISNSVPLKDEGTGDVLPTEGIRYQLEDFVSSNQLVIESLTAHRKILIACLNGPVIGLSASIILLCDLVYCLDIDNLYMQLAQASPTPRRSDDDPRLSNHSKMGEDVEARCIERLLCGERITGRDLNNTVRHTVRERCTALQETGSPDNHDIDNEIQTELNVKLFNESILSDLREKCNYISLPSILKMKRMIIECQASTDSLRLVNSKEVHSFLSLWIEGEPQKKFKVLGERSK